MRKERFLRRAAVLHDERFAAAIDHTGKANGHVPGPARDRACRFAPARERCASLFRLHHYLPRQLDIGNRVYRPGYCLEWKRRVSALPRPPLPLKHPHLLPVGQFDTRLEAFTVPIPVAKSQPVPDA